MPQRNRALPRLYNPHATVNRNVMLDDAEASQRVMTVGRGEAGAGKPRERHFYSYWAK